MTTANPIILARIEAAVTAKLQSGGRHPLIVGICGAQGSGKSTVADALARRFTAQGLTTAILSLDDLYKTKEERTEMARAIHPLFRTRGVPGTHDVALGLSVIHTLRAGRATLLPRFDKAIDDRAPVDAWETAPADTRILFLEGWMVGAWPESDPALAEPVNALERDEDPHGTWRRYANGALADYRPLFNEIDLLVLLAAPGFDVVRRWRTEQEQALRRRTCSGMGDTEIARFVAHYERLTRHILDDMPARADLVVRLNFDRSPRISDLA